MSGFLRFVSFYYSKSSRENFIEKSYDGTPTRRERLPLIIFAYLQLIASIVLIFIPLIEKYILFFVFIFSLYILYFTKFSIVYYIYLYIIYKRKNKSINDIIITSVFFDGNKNIGLKNIISQFYKIKMHDSKSYKLVYYLKKRDKENNILVKEKYIKLKIYRKKIKLNNQTILSRPLSCFEELKEALQNLSHL